jgi:hypothetical protein
MAIKEESDEDASPRTAKKRKRGSYQNWFSPDLWPPIHEAVKKHCNLSSALRYLRAAHRQLGHPNGPNEKLSRTSLSIWFTSGGELRSKFCNAIETESANLASHSYSQRLDRKPKLKKEIMSLLKELRLTGQSLSAPVVQPLIRGLIEA